MQFYITQKNLIVFQRAYLEILDSVLGFFDCFFLSEFQWEMKLCQYSDC